MDSQTASDRSKRAAAERALEFVWPGMRLGLGTGSTVEFFLSALGARVRAGLPVVGVPTSEKTRQSAIAHGIALTSLDDEPELDLAVDGADEFDPSLRLVKGGGGALLREKVVAASAKRMIVIADASKRVETLGKFPLPVEALPFGLKAIERNLAVAAARAGCRGQLTLRLGPDGHPFVTDGGHWLVDCAFGTLRDPEALAREISTVPGALEHGLFIGMARAVIVGEGDETTIIGDPGRAYPGERK